MSATASPICSCCSHPCKDGDTSRSPGRRTAVDYAQILKALSDTHFPAASKIVLVQDNLSTHKSASLYEAFPPAEVRRLAERRRRLAQLADARVDQALAQAAEGTIRADRLRDERDNAEARVQTAQKEAETLRQANTDRKAMGWARLTAAWRGSNEPS